MLALVTNSVACLRCRLMCLPDITSSTDLLHRSDNGTAAKSVMKSKTNTHVGPVRTALPTHTDGRPVSVQLQVGILVEFTSSNMFPLITHSISLHSTFRCVAYFACEQASCLLLPACHCC